MGSSDVRKCWFSIMRLISALYSSEAQGNVNKIKKYPNGYFLVIVEKERVAPYRSSPRVWIFCCCLHSKKYSNRLQFSHEALPELLFSIDKNRSAKGGADFCFYGEGENRTPVHMILFSDSTVRSQSSPLRVLNTKTLRLTECFGTDSLWLKRESRKAHARFRVYNTWCSLSDVGKIDVTYAEA